LVVTQGKQKEFEERERESREFYKRLDLFPPPPKPVWRKAFLMNSIGFDRMQSCVPIPKALVGNIPVGIESYKNFMFFLQSKGGLIE
jgi:hypothetical protein